MASLSDTLTAVGVVLVLLFGSISLYLYTRVQQTDQKVSLLESIVLDLKLTNEIPMFHDSHEPVASLPSASIAVPAVIAVEEHKEEVSSAAATSASASSPVSPVSPATEYKPFEPEEETQSEPVQLVQLPTEDYEGMSVKELQALARSRGLMIEKGAKKHQLIELLTATATAPLPSSLSLEILDA